MPRKIIVTIIDDDQISISGETTFDSVNELYQKHKLNGIMAIVESVNYELNKVSKLPEKLLIPNEMNELVNKEKYG